MRTRPIMMIALVLFAAGCGSASSSSTPTTPTTPTTPSTSTLSLAGNWTGTIVPIDSTGAENVTWVATQTGSNVTGPLTITLSRGGTAAATLSGTISGTSLSVTYSLTTRPGAPAGCTESGTGTATTVTANAITVQIQRTYTAACASAVPSLTPSADRLVLTK